MKFLLVMCLVSISQLSSAVVSMAGKYKLVQEGIYFETDEIIFLINSMDDIKILGDNDKNYELSSSRFFTDVTMNISGGSDEDWMDGKIVIATKGKKLRIVESCLAAIDGPNGWIRDVSSDQNLFKWNKSTKKYVKIKKVRRHKDCIEDITANYPEYEID